ncbi:MAG: 3-deoxy-7-phosphoheptulonate synthase [Chthoniobacteraceae bacterium]|nr:3-deoxy-7-phosphoheptulonate synthase [Chthoniobacteraceae bacterium]
MKLRIEGCGESAKLADHFRHATLCHAIAKGPTHKPKFVQMIVVIRPNTPRDKVDEVIEEVKRLGYDPRPIFGTEQTIVAAIGDERTHHTLESLSFLSQVEKVMTVQKRYKLLSRESIPNSSIVNVDGVEIGGGKFCVMAGPCSVESEEQLLSTARAVKAAGATILRGGAYKPRTSPYEFQGLGKEGLRLLQVAKEETGLKIITEVLSENHVEHVSKTADILQVGARNSQNYQLLIECARSGKPVLLKRGLSERIDEWLLAAEYILAHGNPNVIFCERGIRTFETYTRNTLDLAAVAIIKKESHLPVIIDPSQGCGRADLVRALCGGAVAMGADGLLIEVHPNPAEALSDGQQQVDFKGFSQLMEGLKPLLNAMGRTV